MFRRERPQKGRYRQFYQIDAEVFGVQSPYIDSEMIFLLHTLLQRLGLEGLSAHINSLGCPVCRPDFQKALLDFLGERKDKLCENCKRRLVKNPLRILDCKVQTCRQALEGAPATGDHLCPDCRTHFKTVKHSLEKLGVDFIIDDTLVRGLDYYTRTAWEVQTTTLGAQSAVAGGGRYDGLVEALGGPSTPAIGFAIGFDRLVEVMEQLDNQTCEKAPDIFIVSLGADAREYAFEWSCRLNTMGIRTDTDFRGKSMKASMKRANKLNAAFVLIVGDNELARKKLVLRNMATKEQTEIGLDNLVNDLKKLIRV
jgi:histidyl-tRNA synthetase